MNRVEVRTPFIEVFDDLKGKDIYVTLDIDVVDPAFAPGTGTPEPGGCTSKDMLENPQGIINSFMLIGDWLCL